MNNKTLNQNRIESGSYNSDSCGYYAMCHLNKNQVARGIK